MTPDAIVLTWAACGAVVWFKVLNREGDSYWAAILATTGPLILVYWLAPRLWVRAWLLVYRAVCWMTWERPR